MTLEQRIRNFAITYDELFVNKHVVWPNTITVLEDIDGVLKVEVFNSESQSTSTRFLNGDKFHLTQEEAFMAEL